MNVRTLALGVGTAVTTFLVVGATTVQFLDAGEAPGISILGVLVGLVTGLLADGVVVVRAIDPPLTQDTSSLNQDCPG